MSSENREFETPLLDHQSLDARLDFQYRTVYSGLLRQLGDKPPLVAFGDPEFENANLALAATTNAIAAKVRFAHEPVERQAAYASLLWARHVGGVLLGVPAEFDTEKFADRYELASKNALISESDGYFRGKICLETLTRSFMEKITVGNRYVRSTEVAAGLTFKAIDEAAYKRAIDTRVEAFRQELSRLPTAGRM